MTPAVRRWLLCKAREDLHDAEAEEAFCRKDLASLRQSAAENPQAWGEELERAERAAAESANHVRSMRVVVADLSEV